MFAQTYYGYPNQPHAFYDYESQTYGQPIYNVPDYSDYYEVQAPCDYGDYEVQGPCDYAEAVYADADYDGGVEEGDYAEGVSDYPQGLYAEGVYSEDVYAEGVYAEGVQSNYEAFHYDYEAQMPYGLSNKNGVSGARSYDYYYEPVVLPPLTLEDFPKANIHTLYIPYMDERFSEEDIRGLFTKYSIAMVKNVDFVSKANPMEGTTQRSAYIHIKYWFFSRVAANFIQRLEDGKETRLVVNDPEYWLVFASNAKKHTENGRRLRLNLFSTEHNDIPALVNVEVVDERTAYKYEMKFAKQDEVSDGYDILHSTANSPFDTLDIGLKRDDDYFSDESVEEYHQDRSVRRRVLECP